VGGNASQATAKRHGRPLITNHGLTPLPCHPIAPHLQILYPNPMMPQQFIAKWRAVNLSERSACQQHFLDLCELLGQPKPAEADPEGTWYTFEYGVKKTDGGDGWADVWRRSCFGWEYKGKHKNLEAAYNQPAKVSKVVFRACV
jgi:hypothetical protein